MSDQYPDEFAFIQYHTNFPDINDPFYLFNSQEVNARRTFYTNGYVPQFYVDAYDAGSGYQNWENILLVRYNQPSDWEIMTDGSYNETTREAFLNIDVFLYGDDPDGVEYLRIALVENDIYYPGSNGTDYHQQTFRDMIPDVTGQVIEVDDTGIWEGSVQFTVDEVIAEQNCEIVVFIQSSVQKEVLQGYKMPFDDLGPVSVDDDEPRPQSFRLLGNYPNPFNSSTNIRYILDENADVRIDVFNIRGEYVATPVNEFQQKGLHSARWDASSIPSGIYFYTLKAGMNSATKRMTLVK
ncbi:MAG: T9SS type A sorting domain-containing protein [candidate division Zixibacteria bacterium]|nr:T9SS type A sorting domain-containing protein [candidate division Zixibacteria bacterium]